MKLNQSHVGKKMQLKDWEYGYHQILCVGAEKYFYRNEEGYETSVFNIDHDWKEYIPFSKKKTVRMAPAIGRLVNTSSKNIFIHDTLYENEAQAKAGMGMYFLKWPANENMWCEVEVEED